jgi:hypothetical protein
VSKIIGKENFQKFQTWRDSLLTLAESSDNWDVFKPYAYRGDLSKTRVSQATNIDLNALKSDGNKAIYDDFKDLESMLQKKIQTFLSLSFQHLNNIIRMLINLSMKVGNFLLMQKVILT